MTLHIRALERALICQRTQLRVTPAVHTFVDDWELACDQDQPLPDALDLLRQVTIAGIITLTPGLVVGYLDQCCHQRRIPDSERLLALIVHGVMERTFPPKTHCRCPFRRPGMQLSA